MLIGRSPGGFVGRERELGELRAGVAAARAGDGGVILVSGPPGIGKSWLVTEALTDEVNVVRGRCLSEEGAPPLWPWLRLLARAPAHVPAEIAPGSSAQVGLDASESAAARFRLLVSLTDALFGAAAESQGLVVVIEDLHDADAGSLALLRQVALDAADSQLLVIGTHRGGARQDPTFGWTLAEVGRCRGTSSVELAPLTVHEVGRYLSGVSGDTALADSVHQRTGGLPLLVAAMARALQQRGTARGAALPALPAADLRLLVAGILGGIGPEARDTATAAAVLGEEIDAALLADVVELSPSVLSGHLALLTGAGLLTASGDQPPLYRFAHALVREGVVAESVTAAAALHRRAAASLELRPGADPANAARIAAHWRRSGDDNEALRATVNWARVGAEHALQQFAPEEAARLLGVAVGASTRSNAGQGEHAELLVELASAEYLAGQIRESAAHCRAAAVAAESADRLDLLTAAALVIHDIGSPGMVAETNALCDRALHALDVAAHQGGAITSASVVARSRLLAQKAWAGAEADRWDEAERASAEALQLAEACGDPVALLDAANARVGVMNRPTDAAERLRMGNIAVRTGPRAGQPMAAVMGHTWRIGALYQLVDGAGVDDEIAQLALLAESTGLPLARWHALRVAATRAALVGRFDEARSLSLTAHEIAVRMSNPSLTGITYAFGIQIALVRGDRRDLLAGTADEFAHAPEIPIVQANRALFQHLDGARDAATGSYERLRVLLREGMAGPRGMAVLQIATELIEAFNDQEAAGWAFPSWQPWAATGGSAGSVGMLGSGAAARGMGRIAAVLGRLDEAADALRVASEINVRLDAHPWLTHTRLDLADVLRRRGGAGDHEEAAALVSRAAAEARRLDLPGPLARADLLHAQLAALRRASDPLTPREREVAGLVAKALSNRQIADRLVLSERTVESHVRNVLGKFGLTSRVELTVRLLGNEPIPSTPERARNA